MPRKRKADLSSDEGRSLATNEEDSSNSNEPHRTSDSDAQQVNNSLAGDARSNASSPEQQAAAFQSEAHSTSMLQAPNTPAQALPMIYNPLSILLVSINNNAGRIHSHAYSSYDSRIAAANHHHPNHLFNRFAVPTIPPTQQQTLLVISQLLAADQERQRQIILATGMLLAQQPGPGEIPSVRNLDPASILSILQLQGIFQNHAQPSAMMYPSPAPFLASPSHSYHPIRLPHTVQNQSATAAGTATTPEPALTATRVNRTTPRAPVTLYMPCDDDMLSEYQCLLRKHIELFEASDDDISTVGQGRIRRVQAGQVGVRCTHCRHIPKLARTKGCVYFPFQAANVYQASQNMTAVHLCDNCPHIPESTKAELQRLAKEPKSTAGGGKRYWSEGIRAAGIVEDAEGRLRFGKE